jgi:hypothetical protein
MNSLEMIVLAATFVMTLVVALRALDSTTLFGPVGSKVVSVCVSLLSVIGLHQAMGTSIDVLLIPYAVLAIMVLLYWSSALKQWCLGSKRERYYEHRPGSKNKNIRRTDHESQKRFLRRE